eukprot:429573_1
MINYGQKLLITMIHQYVHQYIADGNIDSIEQILLLLQEKENQRFVTQDVIDNNDYTSENQSSTDPHDEKKINDNDNLPRDTILANLSKYKRNIADGNLDSMAQILALLEEKEHKPLGHSQP